jgi:hypothetical protein
MPVRLSEAYGPMEPPPKPSHIRNKRKNYTMIEDFDFVDNNYNDIKNIGTTTPSPTVSTVGPNGYNSDDIVTSHKNKVYSYPPPNYMLNNSLSNFPPQYITNFKTDQMREKSFYETQAEVSKNMVFTNVEESGGSPYPPAKVPYLNDASGSGDRNAVMGQPIRERYNNQVYGYYPRQGMGCMDAANHVMNCPMCSRYFKCDTRIYNIIIFMMLVVFTIIIYFLYREERR